MTSYFHVTNGEIDDGPRALPSSWRNHSGLDRASAASLKAKGWLPQEIIGFTPFDPARQTRTGPVNEVQADKVVSTWTVTNRSLAVVKAARKAELAAIRFAHETGGIEVGGMTVGTDRQDQAMVTGAQLAFDKGTVTSVQWKTQRGFVTLDAQALATVSQAIALHVEACFGRESDLTDAIDACTTVAEVAAVDLEAGW